jgi:hypothetical protein
MDRLATVNIFGWTIDCGSAPDWIAAVGTVGSLFVVVVGLLREVKRRRLDDEAAAAERRHTQAQQARLVTLISDAWELAGVRLILRNDSQLPIFEVRPGVLVADETGQHTIELPGQVRDPIRLHRVVGGNGDLRLLFETHEPLGADPRSVTDLVFTDADGRRWRRMNNGQPTLVLDA